MNENSSRHLMVLRKEEGQNIFLTDGKGYRARCLIFKTGKRITEVQVLEMDFIPGRKNKIIIAISFAKSTSRMEWFLEKATEIGVEEIIPLICHRSEKEYFKFERFSHILEAALIQSRQFWLPRISSPLLLENLLTREGNYQKFIAHCLPGEKPPLLDLLKPGKDALIAIGPEGDFTSSEVDQALHSDFIATSLGANRLRTETAGIVASGLIRNFLGE